MAETETTVLTVLSLFLPLSCNCSYGVVSVSSIGVVTVFTVWSLFLSLGLLMFLRCSYKPNGRNRDHTVRTVTNPMVETETTPAEQLQTQWKKPSPHGKDGSKPNGRNTDPDSTIGFVTVLTGLSLFLQLGL
jgi:hypothetical protein